MSTSREEIEWWIEKIFYSIGIILTFSVSIIHTRHVYLDVRSADTKKWDSPALRRTYNLMSFCTLASLYCYTWNLIISLLSIVPFVHAICPFIVINGAWSFLLAKTFMYLVFVQRLFIVFDSSAYRYRTTTLLLVSGFIIAASFAINIAVSVKIQTYDGHLSRSYMRYCNADIPIYIAVLIAVYDFGLSIYSSVAFILPLRKLIKHGMNDEVKRNSSSEKRLVALFNTAAKIAILATSASLTTILLMVLIAAGIGNQLAPFDFLTNMICMMLMTQYYDKKHYRRLCCGPIWCSKCCMQCCCGFTQQPSMRLSIATIQRPTLQEMPSMAMSMDKTRIRDNSTLDIEVTQTTTV